jgi:hypothetical protein
MEITYELIIKFLVNRNSNKETNSKSNNFITQKNIFNYSINFPNKFKEILTDKFYRYGVTINDNENNNISFWSSILTLIDKNFIIPYSLDELELINQFKTQLIEKYSKSKLSTFLKKLEKNDLRERFKVDQDIYTLQYLVDILDINILIFDWETLNIYTVYHKNILNPWKKTILLAKYKKYWEPILMIKIKGETERLFDYNNSTIKKILTTTKLVSYFEGEKINKEFILNDDIFFIIQQEKSKLKINEASLAKLKSSSTMMNEPKEKVLTFSLARLSEKSKDFLDNEPYQAKLDKLNLSSTMINEPASFESKDFLDNKPVIKEIQTKELINEVSDIESSVKTNSDENNLFTDEDKLEELKKLNKSKLNKMKLDELIDLVKKLKIVIPTKKPTKSILIDIILAKLN